MGRSYFLPILLVSLILALSFSNGSGRKLLHSFGEDEFDSMVREQGATRETIELMDYDSTGPNNSHSMTPPPPPPPPPPPRPST